MLKISLLGEFYVLMPGNLNMCYYFLHLECLIDKDYVGKDL